MGGTARANPKTGLSECTEAVATSLIPLVINFPEICAFIKMFVIVTETPFTGKRDG